MTSLTDEQLQIIQECAHDDESRDRLIQLFEAQQAGLLDEHQRNQARYRAIVDHQTELVCRYQPDFTLTFVNEAYCRFFGRKAQDLIGLDILTFINEESRNAAPDDLYSFVDNPRFMSEELQLRRHDGSLRWIQWMRQPIYNEKDELVEIQAVGRDVTDAKQAIDALNSSEERYRRLIEGSPDGILITHNSAIRYINPALVHMLGGQSAADFVGKTVFDIVHQDNHDLIESRIETQGHDNEMVSQRHERYKRLDGTFLDVEVAITPVELDGEHSSLTFVRDVTRRKKSEEALHFFLERLKVLQDLSIRLSKARTFDEFCELAIDEGRKQVGFDRLGLWFLNEDHTLALGAYGTDASGNTTDCRSAQIPLTDKFQYTLSHPSAPFGFWESTDLFDENQTRIGRGWNALFPLRNGDEIVGFMTADNLLNQQPAEPQQLELLLLYSSTLGHLAARKQAEDALQRQQAAERSFQDRLKRLNEINIDLAQCETFETLCRSAVERGRTELGFDRLSLWLIDENDPQYLHGTYGTDENGNLRPEWQSTIFIPDIRHEAQYKILTGEVLELVIEDANLLDDQRQAIGRGTQAVTGLYDGQRVLGCVYADDLLSSSKFNQHQLELLRLYGTALGHLIKGKRTEDDLRRSEERYRAIFEGASIGICLVDQQGHIRSSNPAFRAMIDYTASELQNMTFAEFTHPDDRDRNLSLFRELIDNKAASYHYEKRYLCKNGDVIWVRLDVSHFPGSASEDIRVLALVQNINDQKIAVSQLQESEARNRALLEAIPDNIFLNDHDGVFLDYHSPTPDKLYIQPEMFLGKRLAEVMPEYTLERILPVFSQAVETGEMQIVEYPIIDGDTTRLFETRVVAYGDNRVLSIVRDVTEQRQAHERLAESEERFRQIAEHVDDVFFIRDIVDNRILYVNPAFERIWQREVQALYDDPGVSENAVLEEDRPAVLAAVQQTAETGQGETEYRIARPDGDIRWMWVRLFSVLNDQGEPYRVAGVIKDVTERKQMEHQNLELALQRERVKLISDFIRDASHEFRTPLSIINSKVYLASRVSDEQERQEHLDGIQSQTETIVKLVESLVTMSRLDSATKSTLMPVDINQLLRALQINFQTRMTESELTLIMQLDENLPQILGDTSDLYQAFYNLLDNAVRYTLPPGSVTIRTSQPQAHQLAVEICDTGSGITSGDLPHIFERFFRGDRAHSTPGFGLGLPMTKKIVEHFGGQITVHSEAGAGSTFTITMPAIETEKAGDELLQAT